VHVTSCANGRYLPYSQFGKGMIAMNGNPIGVNVRWCWADDTSGDPMQALSWGGAAADMYSTLDDLAVFAHAAATGSLVGEKGKAALMDFVDAKYEGINYGFQIFKQNGAIGSLGDMPGFSAMAVYMPQQDVTIVCLANLTATSKKVTSVSALGELAVKLLNEAAGVTPTTKPAVN
jgi:hypothetical protein